MTMFKKPLLTSIALITLGIIFGVLLVSNLSTGIDLGLAEGQDKKLGGPVPIPTPSPTIKALSDNFVAVAKAVKPAVVGIRVTTTGKEVPQNIPKDFFHFFAPNPDQPEREQGFGSGVVLTPDGYIATNNHVVENAEKNGIEVFLSDNSKYKGELVGSDPTTDLAVVKIDAKNLSPAALGESDNLQVGEWVLAIGSPLGLTSTVTQGIVSALGRSIDIIQATEGRSNYGIENFIQTDAAINPGNSGGPLVNMKGEVVGINAAIATTNGRFQGYGFAIPVDLLKTVGSDLIKYGEVRRGYIGVAITAVDRTMGDAIGMKDAKGVMVQSVNKGSAGDLAGLREGDVILSVDGRETNAPNELQSYIATKHVGDAVTVKIFREGQSLEKKVTLKGRETKAVASKDEGKEKDSGGESSVDSRKPLSFDKVGMSVRALTSEEKVRLDLDRGLLVTDVKDYSEAFNRQIRKSYVVLDADKKPMHVPADLKKVFDSHKPGESILMRVRQGADAVAFVAVQIPK
jgi:serine protease Do